MKLSCLQCKYLGVKSGFLCTVGSLTTGNLGNRFWSGECQGTLSFSLSKFRSDVQRIIQHILVTVSLKASYSLRWVLIWYITPFACT